LRSQVLAAGHRARLADTLIAQSCLDHRVGLVTADRGFRHFARTGGLRVLP
jgi:predicted nucleic acid-binding protein